MTEKVVKDMVKNEMTAQNYVQLLGGSQAYQRYKVRGNKAEKDGFTNVALLFWIIAFAEEVHASNHFKALENITGDFFAGASSGFGLGTAAENLEGAIAGENFEVQQMYLSL